MRGRYSLGAFLQQPVEPPPIHQSNADLPRSRARRSGERGVRDAPCLMRCMHRLRRIGLLDCAIADAASPPLGLDDNASAIICSEHEICTVVAGDLRQLHPVAEVIEQNP